MNDLDAWSSAPCFKDILGRFDTIYGKSLEKSSDSDVRRKTLPLIYATQHDSPMCRAAS